MTKTGSTPRWLLAALTGLVPVVILCLLEVGLRITGFGSSEPLFVASESNPGYLEPNPTVARRFVSDPTAPPVTKIDPVFFRSEKPVGSYRIAVQGGSTAAGFPYGYFASLAGMVDHWLSAIFPDREIEVVNTAMSAVNSYTLLDFAEEIASVRPDAVLIYAGHNEYLGLLGVGSSYDVGGRLALNRAYLAVRGLRIFQLLQRARASLRVGGDPAGAGEPGGPPRGDAVTLMAEVVGTTEIALGSPLFLRGVDQFRSNLSSLLAYYRERDIPVYIGTLVSNQADQAPFLSATPGDAEVFARARLRVEQALARGDVERSEAAAAGLVATAPDSADAHFLLGRALALGRRFDDARAAYREAKELDPLRFRAPEAMNAVIRSEAARHGATVVDVEAAFVAASPDGLVGGELILEHLHPNVDGYLLLAEAYVEALRERGVIGDWSGEPPAERMRARRPVTEIDRLAGERRIAALTAGWPFRKPGDPPAIPLLQPNGRIERLAARMASGKLAWSEAMQKGLAHYGKVGDAEEAARIAVNLTTSHPLAASPNAIAAHWLLRLGRTEEALRYLRRAVALAPDEDRYRTALAELLRRSEPST